ncbi:RP-L1 [Acanthosepion pharaonis]|uniref:RP-L1 n=1 Tax=Acanthosepion pharaonis TaxID=158019 RepID=A0A812CEJ9_ACAPH|nr:RP-L1 [Sepia pharaonis]
MLALVINSNGLRRFGPFSIQQVCCKHQRIRFKAPNVPKEKSFVFERKKSSLKKVTPKKESPEFLARKPSDNIWIRSFYPQQSNTLEAAVTKHQEYADPMMLNNMDGLIYADMQLDMKTKKKTKFLANVKSTILYPHQFDSGPPPRCLVLSDKTEDVEKALSAGASFAGGVELITQLKNEVIARSMYDQVLCTPGIFTELMVLRHIFKDKFPHQRKGTLGDDVEAMLHHFLFGVSYESKKLYEDVGSLQVPFGQLNMNKDHLLENFQKLVDKLCQGRSEKLGPFITEIHIIAPPSPEKFQLAAELYVPGFNVAAASEEEEEQPNEEMVEDEEKVTEERNILKS